MQLSWLRIVVACLQQYLAASAQHTGATMRRSEILQREVKVATDWNKILKLSVEEPCRRWRWGYRENPSRRAKLVYSSNADRLIFQCSYLIWFFAYNSKEMLQLGSICGISIQMWTLYSCSSPDPSLLALYSNLFWTFVFSLVIMSLYGIAVSWRLSIANETLSSSWFWKEEAAETQFSCFFFNWGIYLLWPNFYTFKSLWPWAGSVTAIRI